MNVSLQSLCVFFIWVMLSYSISVYLYGFKPLPGLLIQFLFKDYVAASIYVCFDSFIYIHSVYFGSCLRSCTAYDNAYVHLAAATINSVKPAVYLIK